MMAYQKVLLLCLKFFGGDHAQQMEETKEEGF